MPPIPGEYTVAVWLEGSGGGGPPARATLRFDNTRPTPVKPPPAGWFKAGAEISVRLPHPQGPPPPAGIRGYAVAVDRGMPQPPCAEPDVCTEGETDLAGGAEDDRLSLGQLEPGTSYARVVAVSGSGMQSGQVGTLELRVDGSPPEVRLGPLPTGWSNGPVRVQALASDSQSGMDPGDGSKALTAISVDGHPSALAAGGAVVATVHGEGLHVLTPAARDAAGNATWEEEGSPPSATVRIDETAPRVAFSGQQDPAEPERIEASVADVLSGAADDRGSIEVHLAGSRRPFAPIPTTASAGTLVAVWDSDSFPPGRYEFRAVGYDAAGNPTLTTRRDGGDPMELPSPLKQATRVQLGFGGRKLTAQRCARDRGRVRCHRRQIVALDRRPARSRVRFGRGVRLAGKLITREGGRRGGEAVTVVELLDSEGGASERATTVETAGDGSFFARLAPGPSRRVRVEFGGDKLHSRTASRTLRLEVAAAVTLRASTATATVGGAPVVFNGCVAPADPGHRVELQFRLPGLPWSEFRTVETDSQRALPLRLLVQRRRQPRRPLPVPRPRPAPAQLALRRRLLAPGRRHRPLTKNKGRPGDPERPGTAAIWLLLPQGGDLVGDLTDEVLRAGGLLVEGARTRCSTSLRLRLIVVSTRWRWVLRASVVALRRAVVPRRSVRLSDLRSWVR